MHGQDTAGGLHAQLADRGLRHATCLGFQTRANRSKIRRMQAECCFVLLACGLLGQTQQSGLTAQGSGQALPIRGL
jgi:hypothetical protein